MAQDDNTLLQPVGEVYSDAVKVTALGGPVCRNRRWHISRPTVLTEYDLLRMLKALQGMGDGDFDGEIKDEHRTSNVQH